MNTYIEAGMDTIVRVKYNNEESIKSIKKEVNKSHEIAVWTDIKGYENVKVFEGIFFMKSTCVGLENPIKYSSSQNHEFTAEDVLEFKRKLNFSAFGRY